MRLRRGRRGRGCAIGWFVAEWKVRGRVNVGRSGESASWYWRHGWCRGRYGRSSRGRGRGGCSGCGGVCAGRRGHVAREEDWERGFDVGEGRGIEQVLEERRRWAWIELGPEGAKEEKKPSWGWCMRANAQVCKNGECHSLKISCYLCISSKSSHKASADVPWLTALVHTRSLIVHVLAPPPPLLSRHFLHSHAHRHGLPPSPPATPLLCPSAPRRAAASSWSHLCTFQSIRPWQAVHSAHTEIAGL